MAGQRPEAARRRPASAAAVRPLTGTGPGGATSQAGLFRQAGRSLRLARFDQPPAARQPHAGGTLAGYIGEPAAAGAHVEPLILRNAIAASSGYDDSLRARLPGGVRRGWLTGIRADVRPQRDLSAHARRLPGRLAALGAGCDDVPIPKDRGGQARRRLGPAGRAAVRAIARTAGPSAKNLRMSADYLIAGASLTGARTRGRHHAKGGAR